MARAISAAFSRSDSGFRGSMGSAIADAMVRAGDALCLAVAGAHPYPVRSDAADAALTRDGLAALPAVLEAFGALRTDSRASAEYRVALLQHMLRAALEELA